MSSTEVIIEQTRQWLDRFIIHYNICPFAENVVVSNSIDYQVIIASEVEDCLLAMMDYLFKLYSSNEIETALLIFPNAVSSFDDYLEFLAIANQLIEDQGFDNDFQLASFHPDYCFEGEDQQDAANFTNRSPWPMLHLIRQSSIEKGLKFYKNPELIPEKNIKLTRELGYNFLEKLREKCLSREE